MPAPESRILSQPLPVPDGILVIDKPEGPTSHDVVTQARRVLHVRQVGHTGTLDPMATGALALVIGRATRLAQFFSGHSKSYEARLRLGLVTDTWDHTGQVICEQPPENGLPDASAIAAALETFLGEHAQTPPPFSAKRVGGVRAYNLARRGEAVSVDPVPVTLSAASVRALALPLVDITLTCSSGYYVRALAHDLGRRLGCGACLEGLRRTGTGGLGLDHAVTMQTLERDPREAIAHMIPIDAALPDLPAVVLNETGARRAGHGNEVGPADMLDPARAADSETVRLFDPSGRLLAIARATARRGVLHPAVVLK